MEQLCRLLKPLANIYSILLIWFLTLTNLYLFIKPLNDYAKSAGLNTTPIVLDAMNYYTPDEGYQALSTLGSKGRDAYRLANYTDFVLPVLLFLSLSLPNVALGKGCQYVIAPLMYLISDYIENLAEKYVLEIYPDRNDSVMQLACYVGLVKMFFVCGSFLILAINGFKHLSKSKTEKLKSK